MIDGYSIGYPILFYGEGMQLDADDVEGTYHAAYNNLL